MHEIRGRGLAVVRCVRAIREESPRNRSLRSGRYLGKAGPSILERSRLMDTRQAIHSAHARTLDTAGLRREFLVPDVFRPDDVTMTYSQIDRIVVGGIMPVAARVGLPDGLGRAFGVDLFLQRREMGIINIGGAAVIVIEGVAAELGPQEALYIGMGARELAFASTDPGPSGEALRQLRARPSHPARPPADARRCRLGHARGRPQRQPPHYPQIPRSRGDRNLPALHGHDEAGGGEPVEHHALPHP
jgi:hypothetical protein